MHAEYLFYLLVHNPLTSVIENIIFAGNNMTINTVSFLFFLEASQKMVKLYSSPAWKCGYLTEVMQCYESSAKTVPAGMFQ